MTCPCGMNTACQNCEAGRIPHASAFTPMPAAEARRTLRTFLSIAREDKEDD